MNKIEPIAKNRMYSTPCAGKNVWNKSLQSIEKLLIEMFVNICQGSIHIQLTTSSQTFNDFNMTNAAKGSTEKNRIIIVLQMVFIFF